MLNKLKKTDNKGFTIIEVMIVLAIAGLIILIVLLAVPALQRSGRNTAIKSDASTVAGAVSEFRSNNDGANPSAVTATSVTGASGTVAAEVKIQGGTTVSQTATPAIGAIGYVANLKCGSTVTNTRSMQVWYPVEGSTTTYKCIDA